MKNGTVWLGIVGLLVVGVALTQGMWGGYGGGMMGSTGQPGWYGQGMMQGYGYGPGMMGGGMMGEGMGMMSIYPAQAQPVSSTAAKTQLQAFAKGFGPQATIKDIMAFSQNTYAQVVDAQGKGLGEIVMDRYSGNIYPEPGPNMMWNSQYGMGYGMMRGYNNPTNTPAQVVYTQAAAQKLAEQFLSGYLPGAKVIEGQSFGGYYTFDYGRKAIEGMLSVNAYSGEVWVHTWHGTYLGE
ncbi:MAG: peptidase M4 [Thermaceae bacterium]|nr:peptidase M4 [Thermaceae bacterium]